MKTKKIILLDDHSLFLKGMTLILAEFCTNCDVHTYQSIKKLKKDKLKFNEFDLLISDIELPDEDVFELFTALKSKHPEFPILVVSMHKKNAVISKCKTLGIEGYLLKDEDAQLAEAVKTITNGGKYYSKTIVEFCKQTKKISNKLSQREEDVIKLIANGFNNNDISMKLFISVETIKTHKKNIRLKLNMDSISDITEYAKQNFLL